VTVLADSGDELTGLSGVVADVIAALGEVGVGVATLVETLFPPIPSEIILPFAGYLAQQGRLNLVGVVVAATLGGVVGALLLYGFAALIGQERASALVARLPLVDREDVDRASEWFSRHGRPAIFFGRLIPGVRSLISLPAGAQRMPMQQFLLYTTAGTLLWNTLLIGGGWLLGTQWDRVSAYAHWLDRALVAAVVGFVIWLAVRRYRKVRAARATTSD